jgi:hypothetical protein
MQKAKDIPLVLALERLFWKHVQWDKESGCLFWMGYVNKQGYGQYTFQSKTYAVHRIGYCLHYGIANLPDGYELDHLCCVRPCANWEHLEPVTSSINVLRGRSPQLVRERQLRTSCPQGHALMGDNLLLETQKGGIHQRCRVCWRAQTRARGQRYRERQRQLKQQESYGYLSF